MNKKSIYQKLLRTAATLAGTNMKHRAVTLGVVVMTMIALPTKALADDYVASVTIGSTTTNYATLPEAVTAANAAESDVTVTMLGDVDLGATYATFNNTHKVGSGDDERTVKITLDLNGKTITGSKLLVVEIAEGADVAIIDGANSTTAGIINTGTSTSVIYNQGTLAVTGIAISGQDTGLNIGGGAAVVTNCNINGNGDYGILNLGYLTVSGGTVSGGNCGIKSSQKATISGCVISGPIGITNYPNCELTIGAGVTIQNSTACGILAHGSLKLNALPTFTSADNPNGDIALADYYHTEHGVSPYQPITFGTGLTAPASPISVMVYNMVYNNDDNDYDLVEAVLPFVFTKGYKAAFTDSENETVDPADVFTISGANIVLAGGEAVAYDTTKPLVAYNTASDGSLTGLYAPGTTYTTEAAALRAAVNALADGSTLTLCKDVDLGDNYISIKKGTAAQPVTIDLNDYKIKSENKYCVLQVGEYDSTPPTITIKNGTIENSCTENSRAINNYGNLTMSDVSVTGYSAIGNYSTGTLTFKSGTITATGSNGFGIDNTGTLTVSGGIIDGKSVPAIYNNSNAPSCTIGAATIKSDNNLGISAEGNVTLTAWPTFSGNSTDIDLFEDVKIVLGDGFAVPATEFNKMKVSVGGSAPFTITSGYAAHCKDGQSNVIDPTSVFTWSGSGSYVLVLDGGEVKVKYYTVINLGSETIEIDALDKMNTYASLTPAGAGSLVYTSDDERVATVTEGFITAVGVGSCTITVSFPGNDGYAPAESKTIAVSVGWPSMAVTLPAGLSTYYEGHGLCVRNTEGVKMYAVTAVSDDQVTLKEISSRTIPKNTPVIISNTNNSEVYCLFEYPYDTDSENQFAQTFSTDMGTAITAPEFTGTAIGKTGYNPPVTLYGFNGAAFVKMDGPVDIAAHRCWIEIGDAMTIGGARKLSIVFDDETTGIKGVKEVREVKEVKADTWYTVDGRKLEKAPSRKGIYIQNGKKLVIK